MMKQTQIAKLLNINQSHVSMILNGDRNITYRMAKKLSAITHIKESFWMEASPEDLKQAFGQLNQDTVAQNE